MIEYLFDPKAIPTIFVASVRRLLIAEGPNSIHYFSWNLFDLLVHNPTLIQLTENMEAFVDIADRTLFAAQKTEQPSTPCSTIKTCVLHRLEGVPLLPSFAFASIRPTDFYRLQLVEGRVVKVSDSRFMPLRREMACATCGARVEARFSLGDGGQYRAKCSAPLKDSRYRKFYHRMSGADESVCGSTQWKAEGEPLLVELSEATLNIDGQQLFLSLLFEGQNAVRPEPGCNLSLSGYALPLLRDVATALKLRRNRVVFRVLGAEARRRPVTAVAATPAPSSGDAVDPATMVAFRNHLLHSFDPFLADLDHVRLALLLFLVAAAKPRKDGTRRFLSILLIGGSATGKSRALAFVARLLADAFAVNGYAVQDSVNFSVRVSKAKRRLSANAGLLALANEATLLLDDLDQLGAAHRAQLDATLREQRINQKRSGLSYAFNAGLLFAGRPTSGDAAGLSPEAVESFDLVFRLGRGAVETRQVLRAMLDELGEEEQLARGHRFIQRHLEDVKYTQPQLDHNCEQLLTRYADRTQRAGAAIDPSLLLGTLVRLTETHAQLLSRNKCTHFDALSAITLMEFSMGNPNGFNSANAFYVNDIDEYVRFYDKIVSTIFSND